MDFSVIIPAYNVSGIIGRAIRSAAAQTCPPREILVIDDCSTDNTVEVVKPLVQDIPSLRLLSTPTNGGPSAARNVGLRAAKADWIALLDSDDAWDPTKVELQERALRSDPSAVGCYTQCARGPGLFGFGPYPPEGVPDDERVALVDRCQRLARLAILPAPGRVIRRCLPSLGPLPRYE